MNTATKLAVIYGKTLVDQSSKSPAKPSAVIAQVEGSGIVAGQFRHGHCANAEGKTVVLDFAFETTPPFNLCARLGEPASTSTSTSRAPGSSWNPSELSVSQVV